MKEVIVFGHDHTNSLGVVQSLGRSGYNVIAFVWGKKTGLIKSSNFVREIYTAQSPNLCIELMKSKYGASATAVTIIPCCDDAANALEAAGIGKKGSLKSQYCMGEYTINELCDKSLQVKLARECGFDVPFSYIIDSSRTLPEQIEFPCLIKPLVSSKGAKSEIRVCQDLNQLKSNLDSISHSEKVLLQQYIEKSADKLVYGCALSDGTCLLPGIITKTKLFPKKTGLGMINEICPLHDEAKITQIEQLINKIGYRGLFSIEYSTSTKDGKDYFIEINLRNDGTNAVYYKAGVNLPAVFYEDLVHNKQEHGLIVEEKKTMFEMNYFKSILSRESSIIDLIKDLRITDNCKLYYKEDRKPFFKQFYNIILYRLPGMRNKVY